MEVRMFLNIEFMQKMISREKWYIEMAKVDFNLNNNFQSALDDNINKTFR